MLNLTEKDLGQKIRPLRQACLQGKIETNISCVLTKCSGLCICGTIKYIYPCGPPFSSFYSSQTVHHLRSPEKMDVSGYMAHK